jgi:micrococcal nuclease
MPHSQRLASLAASLRETPLALALIVAGAALSLVWLASALGAPSSSEPAEPIAVATTSPPTSAQATSDSVEATATPTATTAATATASEVASSPSQRDPQTSLGSGLKPTGPTQMAQVVSITDGDTIRVTFGGQEYPVRYIGMDAPETHFGTEPFGPEAADANARLVAGKVVILEKDVSETDRYGRLLRYVWLHDDSGWLLVNLELVRLGFAQVATFPPDVKWIDPYLLDAQRDARQAGRGLWAGQDAGSSSTPAPTTATPPRGLVGSSCEPSYPDICIPLNSPDLDCGDIGQRRFRVVYDVPKPDPMRFDGDHDGIGCES